MPIDHLARPGSVQSAHARVVAYIPIVRRLRDKLKCVGRPVSVRPILVVGASIAANGVAREDVGERKACAFGIEAPHLLEGVVAPFLASDDAVRADVLRCSKCGIILAD